MPRPLYGLFTVLHGPRIQNGVPVAPRLFAHEWMYGEESFSDWINDLYNTNKALLPYVFANKLERTARATRDHEENLCSLIEDGYDPLYDDPFLPFNGYERAFTDIITYINRLLPEERTDWFIATLTRSLEKRLRIAHEMAEVRVRDGFARRLEQLRAVSGPNGGVQTPDR
ncbi:hypothetical protein FRC11_008336 [Ceratobasidium sp. 423]|nr:hypothetical protein FRC11_008336 [Ceratobasidium sp. 423]